MAEAGEPKDEALKYILKYIADRLTQYSFTVQIGEILPELIDSKYEKPFLRKNLIGGLTDKEKYDAMLWLQEVGLIKIEQLHKWHDDTGKERIGGYYNITVLDKPALNQLRSLMSEGKTLDDPNAPAIVIYDPATGRGTVNGKSVKLTRQNKAIFNLLVKSPGKPVDRDVLWRAAGHKGKIQQSYHKQEFNTHITNLRKALGKISPQQLQLSDDVLLYAFVKIKEKST